MLVPRTQPGSGLLCEETGGFEPYIESIANSSEDMISMVSAGRGVWLAPEIAFPAISMPLATSGLMQ
jgi:DNA-binding transcriptional LysR family regulator